MYRGVRRTVLVASVLTTIWPITGCGSDAQPSGPASAGNSASSGGSAGNGTGAATNIDVGNPANAGSGSFDTCAAEVSTAKLTPLDMYIMLDVSSSMLEPTAGNLSKWDAVKTALETFLTDSASAGLGVGLQYFPLLKANAPASCTSNADCAASDSGNCFTKWLQRGANRNRALRADGRRVRCRDRRLALRRRPCERRHPSQDRGLPDQLRQIPSDQGRVHRHSARLQHSPQVVSRVQVVNRVTSRINAAQRFYRSALANPLCLEF